MQKGKKKKKKKKIARAESFTTYWLPAQMY